MDVQDYLNNLDIANEFYQRELNTNNDLNLEDYIIELKSKTKKVLEKIEKVEKLDVIKIDYKQKDNESKSKNRKVFKQRKFKKKYYKKKTK